MEDRFVSPTERGQITIPKAVRDKLRITPNTKLRVYEDNGRVILEPVSLLELLFKDIEREAKEKGYTPEEIEREILTSFTYQPDTQLVHQALPRQGCRARP